MIMVKNLNQCQELNQFMEHCPTEEDRQIFSDHLSECSACLIKFMENFFSLDWPLEINLEKEFSYYNFSKSSAGKKLQMNFKNLGLPQA